MSQNLEEVQFKQLDRVQLRTTKNITYLSAPPGSIASPQGAWSVVCVVGASELMLAKDTTMIRVPVADVLKIADHNLNDLNAVLGRLTDGRREKRKRSKEENKGKLDS